MAIKRYRFVVDYRAGDLSWSKGQVTEFEDAYAAWLNRDVPGCLEEIDEKAERAKAEAEIIAKAQAKAEAEAKKEADAKAKAEAETRATDKPPADRQVKEAPAKREA